MLEYAEIFICFYESAITEYGMTKKGMFIGVVSVEIVEQVKCTAEVS